MAENTQEAITVLKLETGDSYQSIQDLRNLVKQYRQEVNQATIGSTEYAAAQNKLNEAQTVLTQTTRQATAVQAENWEGVDLGTKSYNELTQQMKALNAQWRATNNTAERDQLGKQILKINDRLKDMDESTGNFQRNVGDYANGVKKGLDAFKDGLAGTIPGMERFVGIANGFTKNPFIATIGLLASLFVHLTARMKETKEGQESLNKVIDVLNKLLQPIKDIVGDIIDGLEDLFSWLGDELDDTTESVADLGVQVRAFFHAVWKPISMAIEGGLGKFVNYLKAIGAMLRGNMKDAAKYQAEAEMSMAKTAIKYGADALNFEKNYDEAMERIMERRKRRAQQHAKETGKIVRTEIKDVVVDIEKIFADADARRAAGFNNLKPLLEQWLGGDHPKVKEWEAVIEEMSAEEREAMDEDDRYLEGLVKRAEIRKETMAKFVTATASLFGSLADALEADEATASKHAAGIKALRAAETVINTISGAMGAFMGITKDTGGWGIALAAVQAASIMATGYANVRKILATDTSTKATTASVSTSSAAPTVSAPAINYTPQTVSTATGAAEIERLNAGKGDQRVYVVYSDIAKAGKQVAVTQQESSFR